MMIARILRHLFRDRPALLIAACQHEERLISAALSAEAERLWLDYGGDHDRCTDCIVGWDPRADRCGIIIPCDAYPECSLVRQPRRRVH